MNNNSKVSGNVAQYDGFSAGEFNTSVNLFRGDAIFDYPLVSGVPMKNGIGIQILAHYSSNTDRQSKEDNIGNPCGILGLGWQLGYAAIYRANTGLVQPPERENYYYCSPEGGMCQLYQTDRKWLVATLEEASTMELQKSVVSLTLSEQFAQQGLVLTVGSEIAVSEDGYYIIDTIQQYELFVIRNPEGGYQVYYHGITFEPANYDFSRIVYFPRFEVWLITDKQGIRRFFGGLGEHGELQYLVHYHGQVISSGNTKEQERAVFIWNLSKEETIWGNQVSYHYIQDTQSVGEGGLEYTKACYLSEITDSYGYSSRLHYEEKRYENNLKEYLDPYDPYSTLPVSDTGCEQPRYETKYLSEISTYAPQDKWIETIVFHYNVLELYGVSKASGGTAKRLLTSIERKLAKQGVVPTYDFSYVTGQGANLGAMNSLLTATGTKVTYEYIQKQLPQCSSRSYEISTEQYTNHKVWNGKDFSVILLYNATTSKLQICSWVGRFQKWTPKKQPIFEGAGQTEAIVLENSVVLYTTQSGNHITQVLWYRQDPDVIGGWTVEVCDCFDTEYCTVTAGSNWLIVMNRENAHLTCYTYNLLHRSTSKTEQILDSTHSYAIASNYNGYAILDYDIQGIPSHKNSTLGAYYLDGYGQWSQTAAIALPDLIALYDDVNRSITVSLTFSGMLCVLANVTHTETTSFHYELTIWRVADSFTTLNQRIFMINGNTDIWHAEASVWQPMLNGNFIVSGGVVMVYDGTKVYENSSLSTAEFNLKTGVVLYAVGENCLLQSKIMDGQRKEVLAQALFYNPKDAAEFPTVQPIQIYYDQPMEIEEGRYIPTITGTTATFDRFLYDLRDQNPLTQPAAILTQCQSTSLYNGGDFLVYQDNSKLSKYIRIVNGVIQNVNELEGTLPEIPNGTNVFTTKKEQSILLYINTGDSFQEAVSNYQVSSICAEDGFSKTGKAYDYDDSQAVCDSSGGSVKYYKVDVYDQNNRGHGFTRYSYYNSLAEASPEDNMEKAYATDGQLLSTAVYNQDNQLLSKTEFEYSIIRKIAEEPELERTRQIYGAVTEFVKTTTTQDGVVSSVLTRYDGYSGETRESVSSSYNVFGDKITVRQNSLPAVNNYPVLAYQNRLTEVGETSKNWTKNQEASQTVRVDRLIYDTFDNPKCKVLTAKQHLLWNGQHEITKDSNQSWKIQNTIQTIDHTGNVLQQELSNGILQSKLFSEEGNYEIGTITNTELTSGKFFICTFEPYEKIPSIWLNFISSKQSVAGTSSLSVNGKERLPGFLHSIPEGEYFVSFWSIGRLRLEVNGDNVVVMEENEKVWNGWNYHIIKFSVTSESKVAFVFCNDASEEAFVDIFCIAPFFYPPIVQIYKQRLVDASVSAYGEMTRTIYDRRNYAIGTMDEKICSLTIPFYRRMSKFHDPKESVNSELTLCFTGDTSYDRSEWTKKQVSLHNMTAGRLSSAVYVDVRGDGDAELNFSEVTVRYQQGVWTMSVEGEIQTKDGNSADGEWLLITGRQHLFFLNGEMIFATKAKNSSEISSETVELTMNGTVTFSNLVCGTGVMFGVQYLDTAGRVRQGQMYQGEEITVTQNFYDDQNRIIAQTKPTVLSNHIYGYIHDFAALDVSTGIMSGIIAEFYPEDKGFPYVGQVYEQTPLGRVIESGLPSAEYAINPAIAKEERQTTKLSYDPVEIPGISLSKENYYYQVTKTPEGKQSVSILNSEKQQVASAALGGTCALISASCNTYQGTMRIQTDYFPAYFDGDDKAIRIQLYDYCDQLLSKTNPDMDGEIRYSYNERNEKRFTQTPELLQKGKVLYQKYNELHCVIEEGFCMDSWEEMVAHVNEAEYPKENKQILRSYEYGTSLSNLSALTNLTSVQLYSEDGTEGVKESYQYDDFKRIILKTVKIPGVDQLYTESCVYDNCDNIVSITNTSGQRSTFTYDSAGRMVEESLADGLRKTQYSYTANDMIQTMKSEESETEYQYTSAGWIREIQTPLLREQIEYRGTTIREFLVELKTESKDVPLSIRYQLTYDEFGRLSSASCYDDDTYLEGISVKSIEYDKNGNIQSMDMGGRLRNYVYQQHSNRLLSVEGTQFTYNADGAVTSVSGDEDLRITYEFGKPVSFQTKDTSFHVLYDTSGNRLMKTTAEGNQTLYLYRQDRLSEKIKISEDQSEQYLYGQYGLRAIIGKDKIQDVYTDHLGSPRIIGEQDKVVAATQYAPFGKEVPICGEMEFGFNGYSKEKETALYYSSYRLYNPEIGRFYSIDPKEGNESPYLFCGNDPFNKIDPSGDSWWGVLLGAVVGVIGIAATVLTAGACCPALLAAEAPLVAEIAVGAVSGAVGSVAGNLVTAACDKEPITAKMVIGSVVSGAISGLGALAGPTGQLAMRTAMYAEASVAKVTAIGIATSCTIGASIGVVGTLAYDSITDTPISGVSLLVSGLAGMGTGLLSSRAVYGLMKPGGVKTLPVMIEGNETNSIVNGLDILGLDVLVGDERLNVGATFADRYTNINFFSFIDEPTFKSTGQNMLTDGTNPFMVSTGVNHGTFSEAVITCHGFGQHCFVVTNYAGETVYRPILGSKFVNYFTNVYGGLIQEARSVKLLICFSGGSPRSFSTAQKFANALGKTVYATKYISYPEKTDQIYRTFQ